MTPRELTNEIVKILDKKKALDITAIKTIEGRATGWILLDFGSVLVHLFQKDQREYYNLERLWNDAQQLDISDLLTD